MTAPEVKVTAEDRELAAIAAVTAEYRECILAGKLDDGPFVQAFARHRATATAPLEARIAALEGAMREAVGVIDALIGLAVDGGLTNDLVAAIYPDSKKPNGQPLDQFAKRARRETNEARATAASLTAMLADDGETK